MTQKALTLAESTTIAVVSDLQVALANLMEDDAGLQVEVDCSAVRTIDAAALQCLLMAKRCAKTGGKALKIVAPSDDFNRIANYVGLVGELTAG